METRINTDYRKVTTDFKTIYEINNKIINTGDYNTYRSEFLKEINRLLEIRRTINE